jgi:tetraacyldisaccharide 4'-kinase
MNSFNLNSYLYLLAVKFCQYCYHFFFKPKKLPIPVVVIGNITVGGTGKTPLVIYLSCLLTEAGFKPGIISRGYRGKHKFSTLVEETSDPALVGDEALLIKKKTNCPMVVGKKRFDAAKKLLENYTVDIILSDDGLQHYALPRDLEIVVIDGIRQFGNGAYLPVGPLREPVSRLKTVDFIIANHNTHHPLTSYYFHYVPKTIFQIKYPTHTLTLEDLRGKTVHAVAGIGDPNRFFRLLTEQGLIVIPHFYPDHHDFQAKDLEFSDNNYVIMTEKDAVKCRLFSDERHWALAIDTIVDPNFSLEFLKRLRGLEYGQKTT